MGETRAERLRGFLEQARQHARSPRPMEYVSVVEQVRAEIEFARAWGLAVGLVEGGYIEMPFGYSVEEAIKAAWTKVQGECGE